VKFASEAVARGEVKGLIEKEEIVLDLSDLEDEVQSDGKVNALDNAFTAKAPATISSRKLRRNVEKPNILFIVADDHRWDITTKI
jgi:hypothetical protein